MQLFSLENLRIDVEWTEQGEQFGFMIRELESTPFCWYHYVQSKDNTIWQEQIWANFTSQTNKIAIFDDI